MQPGRGSGIGRDGLHDVQRERQKAGRVENKALGIAHPASTVGRAARDTCRRGARRSVRASSGGRRPRTYRSPPCPATRARRSRRPAPCTSLRVCPGSPRCARRSGGKSPYRDRSRAAEFDRPTPRSVRAPIPGRTHSSTAASEIRWLACLPHTTNRATCELTNDPGYVRNNSTSAPLSRWDLAVSAS